MRREKSFLFLVDLVLGCVDCGESRLILRRNIACSKLTRVVPGVITQNLFQPHEKQVSVSGRVLFCAALGLLFWN